MQDELLTRCPHCGTTFKLSQTQLNTAQGAVRCGACLQVFHASEYIIDSQDVDLDPDLAKLSEEIDRLTQEPEAETSTAEMEAENQFTATSLDGDALDEQYLEDADFSQFNDPDLGTEPLQESQVNFNDPIPAAEHSDPFYGDGEIDFSKQPNKSNDDEAWAEALLRELDSEDKFGEPELDDPSIAATQSLQESKGTLTIDDDTFDEDSFDEDSLRQEFSNISNDDNIFDMETDADSFDFSDALTEEEPGKDSLDALAAEEEAFSPFGEIEQNSEFGLNSADESWAKAMLEELEEETREYPQELQLTEERGEEESWYGTGKTRPDTPKPLEQSNENYSDDFINLVDNGDANNFLESDEIPDLLSDEETPNMQDEFLVDLDSEQTIAVDITQTSRPQTGRFAGGIVLNIVAATVLFGQYIWFNYDQLSRDNQYRPGLQSVCEVLGCTLPPQQDIKKIKGSNLVVRSHPSEVNALVVDTIVYNRANFEQPFPMLELVFSDLNGSLIARRAFKPEEYQKGDLQKLKAMPSNTPIHLSLEIVDPGKQAVNYEMHFLSTEDAAG